LSPVDSPVYALRRDSVEGLDQVLVLVNTDVQNPQTLALEEEHLGELAEAKIDLLGQKVGAPQKTSDGMRAFQLEAGACLCLSTSAEPRGLGGDEYRRLRAQAAFGVTALACVLPMEKIGPHDWRALAKLVDADPAKFLAALAHLDAERATTDLLNA